MTFTYFILQAAPGAGSPFDSFIWFGAIIAVFYLFMIRPQIRKQKDQREFSSGIKKGDEIVTNSGIVGRVNKIEDKYITLETSKSFIKILASTVSKELTDSISDQPATKKKGLFGF